MELGKGGFGSVFLVKNQAGDSFACKKITKRIPGGNAQPQSRHIENIKREVAVMRKLGGTLNTTHLFDAFEDEESVFLVMEHCTGGELFQNLGSRHYSEGTVKSYMRAVLRTIAQCHHNGILHRDIKPSNFLLLTPDEDSPIKAIDFGLAIFYEDSELPLCNLGLEGTPWFMAPELLSSKAGPSIDVFAAGVMCYQLLTGTMPFNDWKNSKTPALSAVWKSILTDEPKMSGSLWADISEEAKDFVKALLVKDPSQRIQAKEALHHPWLKEGKKTQRKEGKPLDRSVVQRLQRYAVGNAFKKTVLELMTNELLQRHEERMAADRRTLAQGQPTLPTLPQTFQADKGMRSVYSHGALSQSINEGSQSGKRRANERMIARDLLMSKSVHGGSAFHHLSSAQPTFLAPIVTRAAEQQEPAADMRSLADKVAAVSSPSSTSPHKYHQSLASPGKNDSTSNLQSYSLLLGAAQEVKNGLGGTGKIQSRERVSSLLSLLDFVDSKKSEHGKVRRLMLDTSTRGGSAVLSTLMAEGVSSSNPQLSQIPSFTVPSPRIETMTAEASPLDPTKHA